ncbi:MAG: hypothetical protein DRP42_05145 [Tenericutes bacterium]|nr:MAG: hypothetical protein DRP42_05145 [Mycoplasmatota bacterium]
MVISYNGKEVIDFQYASAGATAGESIITALGTVSSALTQSVRITDLQVSCGGTGRTIEVLGKNTDGSQYGQSISFDLAANSFYNFSWNIPFRLTAISSTGAVRGIVASASGAGVKYTVSGYLD